MFLLRIKKCFVAKAYLTSFTIFETLIINSVSPPQILHKLCIFPKVLEKKQLMQTWGGWGRANRDYYVKYQAWDAVSTMRRVKQWEESWNYDTQRSTFDELRDLSSGNETLCRMLDITSQTKWFEKEKYRMQKLAVFHLLPKHSLNISFLCIFFMNY